MSKQHENYTVTAQQLEHCRNVLEGIDIFFDCLNRYLPALIRAYELQYLQQTDSELHKMRKLYTLNTISDHNHDQVRDVLRQLRIVRRYKKTETS